MYLKLLVLFIFGIFNRNKNTVKTYKPFLENLSLEDIQTLNNTMHNFHNKTLK